MHGDATPRTFLTYTLDWCRHLLDPSGKVHIRDTCRAAASSSVAGPARTTALHKQLSELRASGIPLCHRSTRFLATDDEVTASAFVDAWAGQPLTDVPYATCMASVAIGPIGLQQPSTIFVGTEAAGLCLIDNTTFAISKSWRLEGAPAHMVATGANSPLRSCRSHTCN